MKIETGRCMEPSSSILPALDAQLRQLEVLLHKSNNGIVDIDLLQRRLPILLLHPSPGEPLRVY